MQYNDLAQKSPSELQKLLTDTRDKLQVTWFKVSNDQSKNVREIREMRTLIARILTLLNVTNNK